MAGKSGRSINNVPENPMKHICLLYTSDAADEL